MSNLNNLRKIISTAMCTGHKAVTIPLETASMIVVEYEKHRVAASDAVGEIDSLKADKARLFSDLEHAKRQVNRLNDLNAEMIKADKS